MSSVITVEKRGGAGGDIEFDDGYDNQGVRSLTIHYSLSLLQGISVTYGNGRTHDHGNTSVTTHTEEISFTDEKPLENITVYVGKNSVYTGDPDNLGVVALGVALGQTAPAVYPPAPDASYIQQYRLKVQGVFGNCSINYIDRLGFYLSPT